MSSAKLRTVGRIINDCRHAPRKKVLVGPDGVLAQLNEWSLKEP